jgi:hypothetical protein
VTTTDPGMEEEMKVDIKWGPLGEVAVVTMGVAVTVVVLVAGGMVGLAAKQADPKTRMVDPKLGQFMGWLCLSAVALIMVYGLKMIVVKH